MTSTSTLPTLRSTPATGGLASVLFRPVEPLLRRFPISGKFAIMAVLLVVPLATLLGQLVQKANADLTYTRGETAAGPLGHELLDVAATVQDHGTLSSLVLAGQGPAKAALEASRMQLAGMMADTDKAIAAVPELGLDHDWLSLKTAIDKLQRPGADAAAIRREHAEVMDRVLALVDLSAEKSGLLLDPEAQSYFMMDIVFQRNGPYVGAVGHLRDVAVHAAARGTWLPDDNARLDGARSAVAAARQQIQARIDSLSRAGEAAPETWAKANASVDAFQRQIEALAKPGPVSTDTMALYGTGATALEAIDTFHNDTHHRLEAWLDARVQNLTRQRASLAALAAFAVLASLYVFFAIRRSVHLSAKATIAAATGLADGELDVPLATDGRDEFGDISRAFERARGNIQRLTHEMNHMSAEHDKGDIDVVIPADTFAGEYQAMAEGINRMVGGHIAVKKKAMACVQAFGEGNFDAPLEAFPGKKAFINDTLEQIRGNLKKLAADVNRVSDAIQRGSLGTRADASAQPGDFGRLTQGINSALDRVTSFIDQMPSPAFVIDREFTLQYINRTGASLGALEPKNATGRKCFEIFKTTDCHTERCSCARAMNTGAPASSETIAKPAAGTFEIAYTGVPIQDPQGRVVGAFEFINDETSIRRSARTSSQVSDYQAVEAQKLVQTLQQLAEGDLGVAFQPATGDASTATAHEAFANIAQALNGFIDTLSSTISDVNAAAQQLNSAAGQVSMTSQTLSQSASEQQRAWSRPLPRCKRWPHRFSKTPTVPRSPTAWPPRPRMRPWKGARRSRRPCKP